MRNDKQERTQAGPVGAFDGSTAPTTRLPGADLPSFPTGVYPGGAPAGDSEAAGRFMTGATSPIFAIATT